MGMVFHLLLSEKKKQLLTLFIVPLGYMLIITAVVLSIPSLPELEAWLLMIGSLSASLFTIIYVFKKQLVVPCEVQISEHGILIRLSRRSFFYTKRERFIAWQQVKHFQKAFLESTESIGLQTVHPASWLQFTAPSGRLQELFLFSNSLHIYSSLHYRQMVDEDKPKTVRSFFDSMPARIIALLLVVTMVACTLWLVLDQGTWKVYAWLRLVYLYLLGLPFLYKVISRRRKKPLHES